MKSIPRHMFLVFIAMLLLACNLSGQELRENTPSTLVPVEPPAIVVVEETPTPALPTTIPDLTEEQLMNATYQGILNPEPFTLADGQYQAGEGSDFLMVSLQPQIAYGDLNQDGLQDAAVLLAENGGGSGVFVTLVAMLNQEGKPHQAGIILVDDRPMIHNLAIQDGLIHLEATIHRASDPMVSPTLLVDETFRLEISGLHLAALTTSTDGGTTRRIVITSPSWGDETSHSLRVTGEMPIGPFENNLLYRIVDATDQEFAAGPFPVNSDGVGGPASFDNTLELPELPAGSTIWLELSENSMMDGSPMAVTRVMLTFKP